MFSLRPLTVFLYSNIGVKRNMVARYCMRRHGPVRTMLIKRKHVCLSSISRELVKSFWSDRPPMTCRSFGFTKCCFFQIHTQYIFSVITFVLSFISKFRVCKIGLVREMYCLDLLLQLTKITKTSKTDRLTAH